MALAKKPPTFKTVWKQRICPNSVKDGEYRIEVSAPWGSKPIAVATQNGFVCVWFECDPEAEMDSFALYCVGTGFGKVNEKRKYLGTVIDGDYVWHFYH